MWMQKQILKIIYWKDKNQHSNKYLRRITKK